MSHNRLHPANHEEPLKITVEPIESGDDCAYIVFAAGHGAQQKQVAANKGAVRVCISTILDDWRVHCEEIRETKRVEKTGVNVAVDL